MAIVKQLRSVCNGWRNRVQPRALSVQQSMQHTRGEHFITDVDAPVASTAS